MIVNGYVKWKSLYYYTIHYTITIFISNSILLLITNIIYYYTTYLLYIIMKSLLLLDFSIKHFNHKSATKKKFMPPIHMWCNNIFRR